MSKSGIRRRFGMVIGLKSASIRKYKKIHQGPGVRDLLVAAHIRNFCIFL